jgi:hypothetical protein
MVRPGPAFRRSRKPWCPAARAPGAMRTLAAPGVPETLGARSCPELIWRSSGLVRGVPGWSGWTGVVEVPWCPGGFGPDPGCRPGGGPILHCSAACGDTGWSRAGPAVAYRSDRVRGRGRGPAPGLSSVVGFRLVSGRFPVGFRSGGRGCGRSWWTAGRTGCRRPARSTARFDGKTRAWCGWLPSGVTCGLQGRQGACGPNGHLCGQSRTFKIIPRGPSGVLSSAGARMPPEYWPRARVRWGESHKAQSPRRAPAQKGPPTRCRSG